MSRKFLTPIDLTGNEIQNVLAQSLGSDPGSPANGQFWYHTGTNSWRARINGSTRELTWVTSTNPAALTVAGTVVLGTAVDAARQDHVHAMPGLATTGVNGFMPGTDKTKLDAATASPTVSTLVLRDAAGRFQAVDPSAPQDVATKSYADTVATGLDVKNSVRVATITTLSATGTTPTYTATGGASARGQITWATGPTAVDGQTIANGDRILVKNEVNGANGIWVRTSANTWDRATDFDADSEVTSGAYTFVEAGTTLGDSGWLLTTDNPIIIGGASGTVTAWAQFTGSGTITGGAGLTKTGSVLDVGAGTGITVNADDVAITVNGVTSALFRQSVALSVVGNGTNATANVTDLTAGTDGMTLRRSGTTLAFGALDLAAAAAITGVLPYDHGGTAQSAYAQGDFLYASAANVLAKRTIGSTGDVLTVVGAVPTWQSKATAGVVSKYAVAVGDAASTSIVVTHNLNSQDVVVAVYSATSTFDEVMCDVRHTSVNTCTLLFTTAPTLNQYRCVVTG